MVSVVFSVCSEDLGPKRRTLGLTLATAAKLREQSRYRNQVALNSSKNCMTASSEGLVNVTLSEFPK